MRCRWMMIPAVMCLWLAMPGRASADSVLLATIAGNDCSGVFGQGFSNCVIPSQYDPDNTPVIIKFNANGSVSEINSGLFPTISGNEFSFTFDGNGGGSWTYTGGLNDPSSLVSFMVAKGGPSFNLFGVTGNTGTFTTPTNPANGQPFGLSHLTFYEGGVTDVAPVPEPTTMLLVGGGLIAVRQLRKRRRSGNPVAGA